MSRGTVVYGLVVVVTLVLCALLVERRRSFMERCEDAGGELTTSVDGHDLCVAPGGDVLRP